MPSFQRWSGRVSLLRPPVPNMLEAHQSLRVRYHSMLHIEVPRCWKVCNEFRGGAGTTFLDRRIRRSVPLKPDADELRARVQLDRRLAQLRVCGSE